MILDEVFDFLDNTGLARTHAIFSTDFLGHSPRYYDYLRCSGADPSLRSLLKVAARLSEIGRAKGSSHPEVSERATILARRAMSVAMDRCH
jgi:hypothetical protein